MAIDLPIKIDHLVDFPFSEELGRVLFAMVEFQIIDQETAFAQPRGRSTDPTNLDDLCREARAGQRHLERSVFHQMVLRVEWRESVDGGIRVRTT